MRLRPSSVRSAPLTVLLAASTVCFAQQPAGETTEQLHTLPALTVIELIVEEPVSSDVQKNGDRFPLRVAEDVLVGDVVVIPAGSRGEGEVVHAARSRGGGKAGELILAARYVKVGEREIKLRSFAGGSGKDRTKSSVALAATLGFPALLVRGGAYVIAAETLANAKTAEDLGLPAAAGPAADPAQDSVQQQATEEP
jgi:hypothetical protein